MSENEEHCRFCKIPLQLFENEAEYVCTKCGYTIQTNVFIDQYEDFQRSRCKSFTNVKKTEYKPKIPYFIKNEHKTIFVNGIEVIRRKSGKRKFRINEMILATIISNRLEDHYDDFIRSFNKNNNKIMKKLEKRLSDIINVMYL